MASYLRGFSLGIALWSASLLAPAAARPVLWVAAQAVEIITGPVTHLTASKVPPQVSHMDERFGLFVIIVLGEAVVQVATGIADTRWHARGTVAAVAAFVLAACAWWLYFLRADDAVIDRSLRGGRRQLALAYVYGYSHLLVFAGITAASVGAEVAIHEAPHLTHLAPAAARALGGGLLADLVGVTALQWAGPHALTTRVAVARTVCIGAMLAVGTAATVLAPMTVLVALGALLLAEVSYETALAMRA